MTVRLAPIGPGEAEEMLRKLSTFPLLDGFRGAAKVDLKALCDVIVRLAAMAEAHSAIAEIEKSAGQTAKIIKTIDEIAFQTNILALNAAVEAARAGDLTRALARQQEVVACLDLAFRGDLFSVFEAVLRDLQEMKP